jgi:effector-binding domain-containing protein
MDESVEYGPIAGTTVYAVEGRAPGNGSDKVGPVVGPLIGRLIGALQAAGSEPRNPGVFWYEDVPDSEEIAVHVSFTADPEPKEAPGYDVVVLPPIDRAGTLIHRGDMMSIGDSWGRLMQGIDEDGYRIVGPVREIYLDTESEDESHWVTQLVAPVSKV